MPFNVASIKDKAISAKNTAVTKTTDFRDRHTSTPMAQTRFSDDGYGIDKRKPPPPPPPPMRNYAHASRPSLSSSQRSSENLNESKARGPPPPVLRVSKPVANASSSAGTQASQDAALDEYEEKEPEQGKMMSVFERAKAFSSSKSLPFTKAPSPVSPASFPARKVSSPAKHDEPSDVDKIDWVNLSNEDKQELFSWLDEFFARYLAKSKSKGMVQAQESEGDTDTGPEVAIVAEPPPEPPVSEATIRTQTPNKPPPIIKSWSKPKIPHTTRPEPIINTGTSDVELTMSHPPSTTHGSQALDVAYYMHPSTSWSSTESEPWYANAKGGTMPPPIQTSTHRMVKGMYTTYGTTRTLLHAALFSDLSTVWTSVSFSLSDSSNTRKNSVISREAAYYPPPDALGGDELRAASEMYGETIASFAEGFVGSGTFCARGECWDLASEALKYFAQFDYVDAPVPSISRTHGHLIFCGRADGGRERQRGRWRGGDDRVRRGDIVEWRKVKINIVGAQKGGYALLGDPDHTAVIVRDSPIQHVGEVRDGMSLNPSALGSLEVIEQSTNQPPEPRRNEYDMSAFEDGEVWIYRPVAMKVYLGYDSFEKLDTSPPADALRL